MLENTVLVVTAFIANSPCSAGDLPDLIRLTYSALAGTLAPPPAAEQEPAVPIRSSVKADGLVCLEDGKVFKSLKRHLRTDHDLDPAGYRVKWGLQKDYPMTAPNYSAARSALAKSLGLGQRLRRAEPELAPAPSAPPARKPRSRRSPSAIQPS